MAELNTVKIKRLEDALSPANHVAYWENTHADRDTAYLGLSLFPAKRTTQLTIEQIKGRRDVPVTITPSALDALPTLRNKISVKSMYMNLPFFREAMHLTEKERMEIELQLNNAESNKDPEGLEIMLAEIYEQLMPIIEGADIQRERMAMEVLAYGALYVTSPEDKGNAVAHQYNYDFDGEWNKNNIITLTGGSRWLDETKNTSTPLQTLLDVVDKIIEERGFRPTRAIVNTNTLNKIIMSKEVMDNYTFGNMTGVTPAINKQSRIAYVEEFTGITFLVYDKVYKDSEGGEQKKLYPDGQITLLPEGNIGNMMIGRTIDEIQFMDYQGTPVGVLPSGVTITSNMLTIAPYRMVRTVSMVALPTVNNLDDIYIVKNGEA